MTDEARPFPKSKQLARGERRYRRKVASAKQWQKIVAAKTGPCRLCVNAGANGGYAAYRSWLIEFHHLVKRGAPFFGDDVEDNIVPLCPIHHALVTDRNPVALTLLAESLTDVRPAEQPAPQALTNCGTLSRHSVRHRTAFASRPQLADHDSTEGGHDYDFTTYWFATCEYGRVVLASRALDRQRGMEAQPWPRMK